jgi:outer membrane lipoprotein SlyB
MKRTPWRAITALVAVAGIAGLALAGCSGSSQNDTPTQSTNQTTRKNEQAVRYTCSMHPEVLQDKPGDCPKCGMKLVEKR